METRKGLLWCAQKSGFYYKLLFNNQNLAKNIKFVIPVYGGTIKQNIFALSSSISAFRQKGQDQKWHWML